MSCSHSVVCALMLIGFTSYSSGDAQSNPDMQRCVADCMYAAASAGDTKSLYYLYTVLPTEFKASVNLTNNLHQGHTLLHYAVYLGNIPSAKLLLKAGAHSNVRCAHGDTPLSFARQGGNAHMITLLIKYGAQDPDKQELNQKAPAGRALGQK